MTHERSASADRSAPARAGVATGGVPNASSPILRDATASTRTAATYYPWFDWLRMALALTVVLVHEGLFEFWKPAGNFAVQVFFALSGWLIGRILLETAARDLPRFYFNRAVRIWVPYYVALAFLVAASLLKDPLTAKWWEFVLYKLLFVYNLFGTQQLATHVADMPLDGTGNHFWSVNAEEQFYLVAPLLLVLAWPAVRRSLALWCAIAAAAWVSGYYASIAFGVTAALATHGREERIMLPAVRAALWAGLVVGAAALWHGAHYTLVAPPVALCIVLLLAVPGRRQAFGAFAGGMSYPLYLNHWIGVFVAGVALKPFGLLDSPLRHAVSVAVALGIAAVLYWHVDRRLLAHRHAFYTPVLGRVAMCIAYGSLAIGLAFGLYTARSA